MKKALTGRGKARAGKEPVVLTLLDPAALVSRAVTMNVRGRKRQRVR